jgi:hypothetical protein
VRGSVVKRGNGYSVVVELDRDPITGKRRQKWHSGYRTKRDAERALTELLAAKDSGSYVEPTKQTLADFVTEWLAAVESTIRPSTHHSTPTTGTCDCTSCPTSAHCSYAASMPAC